MATIKDVAKLAGVNPSTVSRVIANNPKISAETTEKVHQAMKELKYRPNAIARSLVNQSQTKIIGIILPSNNESLFHNPFFIQAISSISVYAQDHGYYIMHGHSREENKEIEILKELVNSQWVDGIILTTVRDNDKCIQYLNETHKPYAVIGKPQDAEHTYWVDNDNVKSMYDATCHMIKKGHKKIAFIGGSEEFKVNKERLQGYKTAMEKHHLPVDDTMIYTKDDSESCGAEGMAYFLRIFTPDVVMTTDDLIAFGACQQAYIVLDKYIPVVGFNNTPVSMYRNPAFSTVDIFANKLGKYAAKLLIDQLEETKMDKNYYIVETKLIDRD